MPRLILCPSCHNHVLVGDHECPSCGAAIRTTTAPRVAGVLALGLALAGCPGEAGDDTTSVGEVGEPEYGVPATSTTASTETGTASATSTSSSEGGGVEYGTADAGFDTSTDGTTGTDTGTGTGTAGEPEYGVPETTGTTGTTGG